MIQRTSTPVHKPATRYSIVAVRATLATLDAWIEQTEETLGNAEDAAYPNDERIDALNDRLTALEAARNELAAIEGAD